MIGSIGALLGFIGVSFLASTSGAVFRPGRWYYEELKKPSWNPPSCFASYLNFTIWRLNPRNAHTKVKEGIPSQS